MPGFETVKLVSLVAAILLALALDHVAPANSAANPAANPAANTEQIVCACQATACAAGEAA